MTSTTRLTLNVDSHLSVSAILVEPTRSCACYVFAHGAGAGMNHAFMETAAAELATRSIATLRFNFPYMEQASGRPDRPSICHATVSAAVKAAASRLPDVPLVAGGKSFGGRMTSQAQAAGLLPRVHGLVFFGFPLHAAGKPDVIRAQHLFEVSVPLLFLQGTRDRLADLDSLKSLAASLGPKATLFLVEEADHSFHVPVRTGRDDRQVLTSIIDAFDSWLKAL